MESGNRSVTSVLGLLLVVSLVGACSSASSSASPASSSASPASSSASPASSSASPASSGTSAGVSGWTPSTPYTGNDPVVLKAIEATVKRTGPQIEWNGPTTSATPKAGQVGVCIPGTAQNDIERLWCQEVQQVAQLIGWTVKIVDGQGSASGWTAAMTQAIALKPNFIVITADALTLKDLNKQATEAGIPVIGIHSYASPGPHPDAFLFDNISSKAADIANAEADYIIADSGGTGKAMIVYTSEANIALTKANDMKAELATCTGCKLLEFSDTPIADISTLTSSNFSNWAAKYGKGWYSMTIYDGYYDFGIPALRSAGFESGDVHLVGSDGTNAAYERIRTGSFQVATVPEPAELFGFMAIDDAIRAMANMPAADWAPTVYLATTQNVNAQGGDRNQYTPQNDYANRYLKMWGQK